MVTVDKIPQLNELLSECGHGYKLGDAILGSGAFGTTVVGCHDQEGCDFAVKIIPLESDEDALETQRENLEYETQIHERLAALSIAPKLFDHFECGDFYFMVMEKLDHTWRSEQKEADELPTGKRARQLWDLISKMHEEGIFQNDMHAGNIMIRKVDDEMRIIDFGLSRWLKSKLPTPAGLLYFADDWELYRTGKGGIEGDALAVNLLYLPQAAEKGEVSIIFETETNRKLHKSTFQSLQRTKERFSDKTGNLLVDFTLTLKKPKKILEVRKYRDEGAGVSLTKQFDPKVRGAAIRFVEWSVLVPERPEGPEQ